MEISTDFIEILRCPACRSRIELKVDGSGLKCVECRRVYPIRDEIPVLLVDEATIEEAETVTA
ncbi:MAG: Trm112 family protein [Acidobacteria bacterium]|nr:Trm112 family protein [Acidobacteriota bacterium]